MKFRDGTIFYSEGCEVNVYAYVPNHLLVVSSGFNLEQYLLDGWGSINNSLQSVPRSSHVIPNINQEAKPSNSLNDFLGRLTKYFDSAKI